MARRKQKEKNAYPCRQQELYETAETAWNLFVLHLGDFTKFTGTYSTRYYEERMRDVEQAKSIQSKVTLQAELKELRKELLVAKKDVLFYYRCIKRYIERAKPNNPGVIICIAGSKNNYKKASNNNWNHCSELKHLLHGCLKNFKEELMKGDNMPESFFTESMAACENFEKINLSYTRLKRKIIFSAMEKVKLNNVVYHDLTVLLNTAQFIYRNRLDMQQLFQFDKLLKTARKKKKEKKTGESKPNALSFLGRVAAMF